VSPDPERAALDARLLAWMREPGAWDETPAAGATGARFDALARELFAFQYARCAPFRRLCDARGRTPSTVRSWRDIPPVPTAAFKEMDLRSFEPERTVHTFRTSGTTAGDGASARGALHLDTLALYEASLLPTFERHVLPDLAPGERMEVLVLGPSRAEAPDSSLTHMFHVVARERGGAGSAFELDLDRAAERLERAERAGRPLLVCGAAFAFVHLLERMADRGRRVGLPPGSRAVETGGYKGRSREVPRDELHARMAESLGLPTERILDQYGMTELGSQFYDSVLRRPGSPRRKLGPPWARVRLVDPATGREVEEGETGTIAVVDLANTGSVLAVQTADRGRRVPARDGDAGFEVLGREPGAEARGCSRALDAMLAAAAPA